MLCCNAKIDLVFFDILFLFFDIQLCETFVEILV